MAQFVNVDKILSIAYSVDQKIAATGQECKGVAAEDQRAHG